MRADKALILGVGALGLYAVYRMFRTTSDVPAGTINAAPGSDTSLPEQPMTPPLAAGLVDVGNPMDLRQGGWLKVRLETAGQNPPFSVDAPRDAMVLALTALGFGTDSRVFMTADEARAAGFPEWVLSGAGIGTRWAWIRWGRPTQPLPRPPAFALAWQARGPA